LFVKEEIKKMEFNLGYFIMGAMIIIPALALIFISKKDVEEYKQNCQNKEY